MPAGSDAPYTAVPGRHTFEDGHIPGADFLDLQGEFSDRSTQLRFMMPAVGQLEDAFGRHGIGTDFEGRALQHRHAACGRRASGGCCARSASRRWCSTAASTSGRRRDARSSAVRPPAIRRRRSRRSRCPATSSTSRRCRRRTAMPATVVVNALGPQFHRGQEPGRYGRPGRIPGSVNVPAATLFDPASKTFVAAGRRAGQIRAAGRDEGQDDRLLLRRRHLRHHRPLHAAPARLREARRSTTPRWANGPGIRRCRSRQGEVAPARGL